MKKILFALYNLLLIIILPLFFVWMSCLYFLKDKKAAGLFNKLFPSLNKGVNEPDFENGVWIHTVSLGELKASANFIDLIIKKTNKPVYLSAVVKTGYDYAKSLYGKDRSRIYIFYFPYDFYFSVKIILNLIKPSLFVCVETEIWPNLFNMLKKRKIPISIINARISNKSYKNYSVLGFFFKYVFESLDLVLCISGGYYEKFLKLGVKRENLHITGNMKFDLSLRNFAEEIDEKAENLKNTFKDGKVIVAGSTHKGEEKLILDAFVKLNKKNGKIFLFIAPRHPERFEYVYNLVADYNLQCYRLSSIYSSNYELIPPFNESLKKASPVDAGIVVLVDIIGELITIYSICDVAFIGGSMVQAGGHNLLEPLFFGKPVIFGKYVENFSEIAGRIIEIKAGKRVGSPAELFNALLYYLYDEKAIKDAKESGLNLISQNKGSSLKNLEYIAGLLKK
ncbi:MAG: 3-deoxy-D-manno-octulosonic acid transferase [Deltaproteobacteria bacterium]|nr:3-deoxy-D-manno-octulosonic acid transferase [Deltaproteobacteria bacterium]